MIAGWSREKRRSPSGMTTKKAKATAKAKAEACGDDNQDAVLSRGLEVEELAEALGLGAADRDLGFAGIVHAELVGGLEPGHDLADVLDVDEEGAMGTPEGLGIELVGELLESSAVGLALDGGGDDGDGALVDGGEADLALVDEQEAVLGADDDLAGGGCGAGDLDLFLEEAEQGVEIGRASCRERVYSNV